MTFTLDDRALSVVDDKGDRKVVPGAVDVWVGGGQPVSRPGLMQAAGVKTSFKVTKSAVLPK